MRTIPLTPFQFFFILCFSIMSISIECYIHGINELGSIIVFCLGAMGMFIILVCKLIDFLSKRVRFQ